MAERGLHASIWASAPNEDGRSGPQPEDWDCPACGFSNYRRRTECFRCSYKGLIEVSANVHAPPNTTKLHNPEFQQECGGWDGRVYSGGSCWQKDSTRTSSHLKSGEQGLAMSRWAPRKYNGRAMPASDVWIRVMFGVPQGIRWLTL